jgi:hypothetical protein
MYEKDGVVMHADVFAQEIKVFGPGQVVELPQKGIDRLRDLRFLERPDGKFTTPGVTGNETGVHNDPRLTTATNRQAPRCRIRKCWKL